MSGIRIGRLLGIAIEVKYSFLLLLFVAFYGGVLRGLGANAVIVLLFGCASVLVHEIAHAFCARALSVPVAGISLHALGGETRLAGMPRRARDEILIALAGPCASLLLAGVGGLWLLLTNSIWAELVIAINLLLTGANLVPALPLDGGRVLRGLMTPALGLTEATRRAVWASRGVAVLFTLGGPLFGLWIALVLGPLLWLSARWEQEITARWAQCHATGAPGSVCVLDVHGKPAGGRPTSLGGTYVIEEHRSYLGKRWVVRDFSGTVLLVTDTPLCDSDGQNAQGSNVCDGAQDDSPSGGPMAFCLM